MKQKRFLSFLTAAAMAASMLPVMSPIAGAASGDWIVALRFREHPSTFSVFKPNTPDKLLWVEFADKVDHDNYDGATKTYHVGDEFYQLEISRDQHGPTESPHPRMSIVPANAVEDSLNDGLRHHYHGWQIGELFDQDKTTEYQVGKYKAAMMKLNIESAEDAATCPPEKKEEVDSKEIEIVDVTYRLSESDKLKGYQLKCPNKGQSEQTINELAMVGDYVTVIGPKVDASGATEAAGGKSMTVSSWKLVKDDVAGNGIGNTIPEGKADGTDDGKITLEAVITETKSYQYDIQDESDESVMPPSPEPGATVAPISLNGKNNEKKIEYSDTKYEQPAKFRIANTGNQRILMVVRGSDTFDVKLVNANKGNESADKSDSEGGLINNGQFLIPPKSEATEKGWKSYATLEVTPKAGLGVGTHTGTISMMEYLGNRGNMKDYTFSVTIDKRTVQIVPKDMEKPYGKTLTNADIICDVYDGKGEELGTQNLTAAQLGVLINSDGMYESATVKDGPYGYSLGEGISTGNYNVTLKEDAVGDGITVTKATPRKNSVRASGISTDETLDEGSRITGTYINPNSHLPVEGTFSWVAGETSWSEPGTQSAKYQFTPNDTDNYETPARDTVSVVVSQKNATNLRATSTKKTYNGSAQTPDFAWDRGGAMRPEVLTVTYKKVGASDTTFVGENFDVGYSAEAPVEAGTYKVHATCEGNDIFAPGETNFIFTIEPYTLSLNFSSDSVVKEYDGTNRAIADSSKITFTKPKADDDVEIVKDAIQGTYNDKNADAFYLKTTTLNALSKEQYQAAYSSAQVPDTYPLTGTAAANYKLPDGPYHPTGKINPRKLTLKLNEGIKKKYGQTYTFTTSDYTAETPLGTGDSLADIRVELVVERNGDKPEATVDTYNVTAKTPAGVRDNNYTITESVIGTITVEKATPQLIDVSAQNALVNQTLADIAGTLKGRAQNEYTGAEVKGTLSWAEPQKQLTLGSNDDCQWKFEPTDKENYTDAYGTIKVTAESRNPMPINIVVPTELVYDGKPHPATVTTEVEGAPVTIEYRKKDVALHSEARADGDWVLDAPVDAGTYEVRATVKEYLTYGENVDEDTIVIDQAAPSGTVTASAVDIGAALSTSQLTHKFTGINGERDVLEGTAQWKNVGVNDPSQIIITSEGSYTWVFLPSNPNYKTVEGQATVSLNPHNRATQGTTVYNIPNSVDSGDYAYVNVDGENLKVGDVVTFYKDSGLENPASAPFLISEEMSGTTPKVNLYNEALSAQGGTIYAQLKYSGSKEEITYLPELGFKLEPAEIDLEVGHGEAKDKQEVEIVPTHDNYVVTDSEWSTLEQDTATAEKTSATTGTVTGKEQGETDLIVKATFTHPDPDAAGHTITVTQQANVEVTNDTFPIYTYTTNAATDITQTSAKLNGYIEINQNNSSLTPRAEMKFKLWEVSAGETAAQTLGTEFTSVSGDYSVMATDLKPGVTYAFRAVGGNNEASSIKEFTLLPPDPAKITVTPEPKTLTYTGEEQALVEPGAAERGIMKYSLTQHGDYTTDIPKGKEVGEYNVWYMAEGTDGSASTEPTYVTARIEKANSDVTIGSNDTVIYGDTFTVTANVKKSASLMAEDLAPDEVKLYIGETEVGSGTVTYTGESDSEGTAEITVKTDKTNFQIGENRIKAEYGGSVSLNGGNSSEIIVNMTQRTLTYEVSAADRVYDTTNNVDVTLTPLNTVPGDDITLSATGAISDSKAGSYSTVDLSGIKTGGNDAGFYSVESDATARPLTKNVEISKANPIVTPPTANDGLKYTGDEQKLIEAGSTDGGKMQYSLDGQSYSTDIPTGTDAKEYTVYYKVVGDENYNGTDAQQITVTIGKAGSTVETTPEPGTVVYGGTFTLTAKVKKSTGYGLAAEQDKVDFYKGETLLGSAKVEYTENGHNDEGTATLTVKADKTFDVDTPNKIKAEYGGSVNLNGETSGEIEVTMTKKALKYDVSAEDKVYNGDSIVNVTLTPNNLESSDNVTLTATGNLSGSDVGEYPEVSLTGIELSGDDAKYYSCEETNENADLTKNVNITKAESIVSQPPTAEDLTYDGTDKKLVSEGEAEGGTMQYSSDGVEYSETIPTGKEAKEYTVYYKVKGDKNHSDTKSEQIKVTIKKADSSTTVTSGSEVIYGEKLTLTANVKRDGAAGISLASAAEDEVEFLVGDTSLGTAKVEYSDGDLKSNGTATLTVDTSKKQLKIGNNTITANYGGSVNLNNSNGNTITVEMKKRTLHYEVTAKDKVYDENATVTVTLTPTDALPGDNVTLTAEGKLKSANADSYGEVNLTNITLGGILSDHYTVDATDKNDVSLTAAVNITRAESSVLTDPTAKDLTYTGENHELVNKGTAAGGTMQYSLDGDSYLESVPTGKEAKEYTVYYKVVGDVNHNDTKPGQVNVTIKKANSSTEVNGVTVQYGSTFTLTANVDKLNAAGYGLMAEQDKVDFYKGDTLLGSATVEYEGNEHDKGTASITVKADKRFNIGSNTIKAVYGGSVNLNGSEKEEIEVKMDKKPLEYRVSATSRMNDKTNVVQVQLYPTNLEGSDDVTLTAKGNVESADVNSYETVNLTDIEMDGADKGYYSVEPSKNDVRLTSPVEITTGESKLIEPPTGKVGLKYTGEAQALIEERGSAENGKVTYAIKEQNSVPSFSDEIPTGTEAKTYTILYKVEGDKGFGDVEQQTLKVTIAKGDSTTEVSGANVTYGDTLTLTADVNKVATASMSLMADENYVEFFADGTSLGTAEVTYSDGNLKSVGTATLTINTTDKKLKIGDNKITASYGGSVNLNGSGSNEFTVKMTEKKLTYDVTAEDKVYDGQETVNVTLTPTNLEGSDDVTVTAAGKVSSANVNDYSTVNLTDITLGGIHRNYYTVDAKADNVTLKDGPVKISKAEPKVTAPTGESLVYNGEEQKLVQAGSTADGTMQYSLEEEGEYTAKIPTAVNVGSYTVWYKVEANANHKDTDPASVTARIRKAGSDVTVDESPTVTYGESVELEAKVSRTGESGMSLMAAEDKVEFFAGSTKLGTANVTYTDDTKKDSGTAKLTINTADKQLAIGANTIKAVYGGSVNLNNSENDQITVMLEKKAITYSVSSSSKAYDGNENVRVTLIPTNIGSDNVTLTAEGTLNSSDVGTYESVKLTNITMKGADAKYYSCEPSNDNAALTTPIDITKVSSNIITAPTAKTLKYTGEEQELVTPGTTSEGSAMQYSVGGEEAYSPNIPKGKDAGTYIVYYKAVGDNNHEDSASHYIHVTIAKIGSEVEAGDATVEYGGELTLTAQIKSELTLAADENKVEFFVGDTSLGTADVTYDEINANGTAELKVTAGKEFTVGENTVRAVYGGGVELNGSNKDNIKVTMTAKPLTYDVAAEGKAYDGNNGVNVTLTPNNEIEGDNVTLTAAGAVEKANVGTYDKLALSDITIGGDDAAYYSVQETANVTLEEAIAITKAEGAATITMENYNCGDNSVEPVIASETNTAPVITYKAKDAEDTAYSADKPLTAGEYIVRAVFPTNDSYNELTVTAEFTVSHSYSTEWKSDADGHWHECVCGDKADMAAHNAVTDAAVAADCENGGMTEGSHCDICDYVIKAQTETQPLGHSWGAWTFTKTPTQTETGAAERVCENDETHKDVKDVIPALSDATVWTKGELVEPTKSTEGYQAYTSEYGTVKEAIPYREYVIKDVTLTETGASVKAANESEAVLIVAAYAEDGKLVSLVIKTIPAAETAASTSVELDTTGAKTVSAFMWKNMKDMTPLCEAFTVIK